MVGHLVTEDDERALSGERRDELFDALVKAYEAGATAVHYAWVNGLADGQQPSHEPDFTEAAHDYAGDVLQ